MCNIGEVFNCLTVTPTASVHSKTSGPENMILTVTILIIIKNNS